MVMYSANCGIVMEMDDSNGIKIEKYYKKAISYATLASIITFIQIFLLIHQMEYTPTPSVSSPSKSIANCCSIFFTLIVSPYAERIQCVLLDDCHAVDYGRLPVSYPPDDGSCCPKRFYTLCHYGVFHICSRVDIWYAVFDGDMAHPAAGSCA